MTQADLARVLGMSQQTVAKYERGHLVPPKDVQARLAAILGASVEDLFPDDVHAREGRVA